MCATACVTDSGGDAGLGVVSTAFERIQAGALEEAEEILKTEIRELLQRKSYLRVADPSSSGQHSNGDIRDLVSVAHSFRLLGHIKFIREDWPRAEKHLQMSCGILDELYGAPFEVPASYSTACWSELVEVLKAQRQHKRAFDVEMYTAGELDEPDSHSVDGQHDDVLAGYDSSSSDQLDSKTDEPAGIDWNLVAGDHADEESNLLAMLKSLVRTFVRSRLSARKRLLAATRQEAATTVTGSRVEGYLSHLSRPMSKCIGTKDGVGERCQALVAAEIADLIAKADFLREKRDHLQMTAQLQGLHSIACFEGQEILTADIEDTSVLIEVLAVMDTTLESLRPSQRGANEAPAADDTSAKEDGELDGVLMAAAAGIAMLAFLPVIFQKRQQRTDASRPKLSKLRTARDAARRHVDNTKPGIVAEGSSSVEVDTVSSGNLPCKNIGEESKPDLRSTPRVSKAERKRRKREGIGVLGSRSPGPAARHGNGHDEDGHGGQDSPPSQQVQPPAAEHLLFTVDQDIRRVSKTEPKGLKTVQSKVRRGNQKAVARISAREPKKPSEHGVSGQTMATGLSDAEAAPVYTGATCTGRSTVRPARSLAPIELEEQSDYDEQLQDRDQLTIETSAPRSPVWSDSLSQGSSNDTGEGSQSGDTHSEQSDGQSGRDCHQKGGTSHRLTEGLQWRAEEKHDDAATKETAKEIAPPPPRRRFVMLTAAEVVARDAALRRAGKGAGKIGSGSGAIAASRRPIRDVRGKHGDITSQRPTARQVGGQQAGLRGNQWESAHPAAAQHQGQHEQSHDLDQHPSWPLDNEGLFYPTLPAVINGTVVPMVFPVPPYLPGTEHGATLLSGTIGRNDGHGAAVVAADAAAAWMAGPAGAVPPFAALHGPGLAAAIQHQVGHYLSDGNLASDSFLLSNLDPATGYVDLGLLCSFKRLNALCCGDLQTAVQALLLAPGQFELQLLPLQLHGVWQPVECARVRFR